MIEGERQEMEDRGRKTGSGGQREKDRKWRIEGERQEVEGRGRKTGSRV
jgi:hypothetical protein